MILEGAYIKSKIIKYASFAADINNSGKSKRDLTQGLCM
jgi:hypothetical protein